MSGAPGLAGFFREFGYSAGAIRLVGAVQIICGVGLLLPKARHLTALATGTVLLLAGSAEIHQQQTALPAGTGWKLVIPGLCLLVPTLVRHYVTRRLNTGTLLLPPTAGGRRSGASSSAVRRCV
ncbi:MAG TPA: hypothetical protein VNQ79_08560 [Blastocatellia bacterium]|nr:hypothetical protein [Blastocatellia bacterium]